MIVMMKPGATGLQIAKVTSYIEQAGYRVHISESEGCVLVGMVGKGRALDRAQLEVMENVAQVMPMSRAFQLTSRDFHPQDTLVRVGHVVVGGADLTIIAGPCSVESRSQVLETAHAVKAAGAHMLRGGAFKPRSSPYSFRGLGEEGLRILAEARQETGLPVVTEVMSPDMLPLVADYADVLQIGARNMQNFDLLCAVGQARLPVMLKRGLMSTLEELLMSAEYIMSQGNHQVILCERGIRTFETYTRNTPDLSAPPLLKQLSHLPVIVDPSHATGRRDLVGPVSKAAVAAGADGLIIEVHPQPDQALSDGPQSLELADFAALMTDLRRVAQAVGRSLALPVSVKT